MRRGDAVKRLHRFQHAFVEANTTGDALCSHCLEADRGEVLLAFDVPGVLELGEALLNRFRIVAHALEAALVEHLLRLARGIEEAPLE